MLAQNQFGCEISSRTVCRRILLENLEKQLRAVPLLQLLVKGVACRFNGLFSDCEKKQLCVIGLDCIICLLCLHHMLGPKRAQLRTYLWDCTSAQTMHWSVVKMVFEAGFWTQVTCWRRSWRKDCLWSVKVQLMKNQKSDSEDYLTKSNYLK